MSGLASRELMLLAATALLAILASLLLRYSRPGRKLADSFDRSAWLPALAATITLATSSATWGSWIDPPPRVQDEAVYLFQAEVFASGRWTAPAPPRPEFFEQIHLLVEPVRAGKYPPGHSLVLAPGMLIGVPSAGPLLLAAAAAALLVVLARRLAGPGVAMLSWALWLSSDLGLRWRPSYFSQLTTSLCALLAWWTLWMWVNSRKPRWLMGTAASIGWMAITRPATAVALGLPVLGVVIWLAWRRRGLRQLLAPASLGLLLLGVLPVWAHQTTGSWSEWPLTRYTREYLPWDRPGFGADTAQPARAIPPAYVPLINAFRDLHASHTLENLPAIASERIGSFRRAGWNGWRRWVAPAFLLGLWMLPGPGLLGITSMLALMGLMLVYAHPWSWMLYYTELAPIVAFFTALGLTTVFQGGLRRLGRVGRELSAGAALAAALGFLPLIEYSLRVDLRRGKAIRQQVARPWTELHTALATLTSPAVVFLRYPTDDQRHHVLVSNHPDLGAAMAWIVHDLGEHNFRLLEVASGRAAYWWDVEAGVLVPHPPAPGTEPGVMPP